MKIRKAGKSDVEKICSIHQYAFDRNHFSSWLPENLLREFYLNLLSDNKYNYIALDDDSEILGFIVAGMNTHKSIDEFVKKNPGQLFLVLLKNPKFWIEKIMLMFRKIKPRVVFRSGAELRLLSIAVKKESGHRGIGTELLSYFENELIKDNIFKYGLSVKKHNQNAINFYYKNKFEVEREEKKALYFIKNLNIDQK